MQTLSHRPSPRGAVPGAVDQGGDGAGGGPDSLARRTAGRGQPGQNQAREPGGARGRHARRDWADHGGVLYAAGACVCARSRRFVRGVRVVHAGVCVCVRARGEGGHM